MLPDLLSAALRGLGFVTILQAGGAVLFLAMSGLQVEAARRDILRLIRGSVLAGMAVLIVQYLLESARMTGQLSGVFDAGLQTFALQSRAAAVLAMRLAGLGLVTWAIRGNGAGVYTYGVAGAVLIALSFVAIGHSLENPSRWFLVPLLGVHLLVVEYWFGSLLPLVLVGARASSGQFAQAVERFSRGAIWLVPLILVAGVVIAARLLPDVAALRTPYGIGLLLKVLLFALLMGLAALNKWRFGPALSSGGRPAFLRFRRSIGAEFVLILLVLMGTATLTTFWSPGP